ncbi:MAG: mandelate racemase/muconate lactonizing enzyme family protein [Chloroflexi bacterium]|nr:mandelate racemase/muconate lactonizing enzyme family protein [Chloroflexota bacterium]
MTIESFRTQLIAMPLERPVEGHPYLGRRENTCLVLLRLRDSDGREGIGLAHTSTIGKARVLDAILAEACPRTVGQDVVDHQAIYDLAYTLLTDMGHTGAALYALSALDTALWDLLGKTLGQPLYRLLGGSGDSVACYQSAGLRRQQDIAGLQQDARDFVERGFKAMKLRLGARPLAEDVERVKAVREVIGPDVDLMTDLNWSFSVPDVIRLGRMLEPYNLYWIEDPVDAEDVEGLAEVSRALDTRVTFGEVLETAAQFRNHLEHRAADCYMIDLQKVGGVTPWLRIANLLDVWRMPAASHVMPEVQAHLVAAIPNGLTIEYNPHHDVLFVEKPRFENGRWLLSQGPGLGLTIDEDVIARFTVN